MKMLKSIVAVGLLAMSVHALAAIELKNEALREVETVDKDGKKIKELKTVERAVPGQEVIYVLTYKNTDKKPATNVVISNPVPKELTYVAGSETGKNARFEVSVDGGKKFATLDKLTIKTADGKLRPAMAADVTNLRWSVTEPVKAGAEGKVSYRTLLK